ncbi:response regulator transcription factor [Sulfurimonas crateris]|uniref:Response regulator transcription factor n=1 Tax=Sulfurimonas crateris TaxID=2574727 RepID=A0A4U2Z8P8_9BACT|nr:LytTR family DNA-binding domain-containing protein [Sulfurimonas crateris]TKI69351.1 response regulator transcription factor [Sulfurimonas crateris]
MKIVIVDDEELARARLARMLRTLGHDAIEASNADEAIKALRQESADIVFLDINMPKVSGLELGYELKYIDPNIAIVFQTAYEEHALKAFDIGAVGYLVKPYSLEQVKQTIERLNSSKQKDQDLRILSKTGDNYLLLKPEEIYYVKADLSEVMLRSAKGFSYYAQKISDLEKKLHGHNFVRIHRSFLINVDEIKEIETIEQSKLRFRFKNVSDTVESSKDGAKKFRNMFG